MQDIVHRKHVCVNSFFMKYERMEKLIQHIDSFEQLREVVASVGDNLKKPLRLLVLASMITMIQLRKVYDHEAEARYAESMEAGESLPALRGNFDLSIPALYCYDGEHRLNAARTKERTHVLMDLVPGTKRDAILNAAGVNAQHGGGEHSATAKNTK